MSIAIVTDTGCNITPKMGRERGIYVLPLNIVFRDDAYIDGVNLTATELFDKMDERDEIPKSAQPSAYDAKMLYEDLLEDYDEIISIHMDSGLSGTFQTMQLVANHIAPERITVYDTKLVSVLAGAVVLEAKRLADLGESRKEITDHIIEYKEHVTAFAMFNSLENLIKGGRINAMVGATIKFTKIKPAFRLDAEEIRFLKVGRQTKRMLEYTLEKTHEYIGQLDYPFKLTIVHGDFPEAVNFYQKALAKRYPNRGTIRVVHLSSVIGVHTGREAIGIMVRPDNSQRK